MMSEWLLRLSVAWDVPNSTLEMSEGFVLISMYSIERSIPIFLMYLLFPYVCCMAYCELCVINYGIIVKVEILAICFASVCIAQQMVPIFCPVT